MYLFINLLCSYLKCNKDQQGVIYKDKLELRSIHDN